MCYIEREILTFWRSEATFRDKRVLARLAGLAQQSRLHGKFSARLAEIPASRYQDHSWLG